MSKQLAHIKRLEARLRERESRRAGPESVGLPWEYLDVAGKARPATEAEERRLEKALRSVARRYAEAAGRSAPWAAYREQCERLGLVPREPDMWDTAFCPIEETLRLLTIPTPTGG